MFWLSALFIEKRVEELHVCIILHVHILSVTCKYVCCACVICMYVYVLVFYHFHVFLLEVIVLIATLCIDKIDM